MKITVVAESFHPDVNGVVRTAAATAESLVRLGHDVTVVAPAPADDGIRASNRLPYRVEWMASRPWPRNRPLRLGLPTPAIGQALRAHRPDALVAVGPYLMGGRALAEARHLGITAGAVYCTDIEMIAGTGASTETRRKARLQLAAVHGMADVNLAQTQAAAAELTRHLAGQPAGRVEIWEPGVDTVAFSPKRRSDRLRAAIAPSGELIVAYVGRLATEKQVDLLAGVARLPGVRLLVVGRGPDASRLREVLAGARFPGVRRGTALARLYASLDVFVHTGAYETFGLTVREAQASGCAVVVPDAGGAACVVRDGVTGRLVSSHDEGAFTQAIAELASDRHTAARLGAAARAAAVTRSWVAAAAELVGHLRAAVDTRQTVRHG
ncbi:glycosyltransferase [Micromonospora sp. NPDC050686]|uniref:glycosyltransferase n=1 Tax=Micromonospora sp. NPDC050686 TaxID=3154631 RepID=UPI00340C9CD9